jgi:DNA invertase Pin-like site-specific DNA recombinase
LEEDCCSGWGCAPVAAAGGGPARCYEDRASGTRDDRPGLAACLKALRSGDVLVVWKLDRLGRNLRHLVNTVHDLTQRGVGFKVLTGHGAAVDTTTPAGQLVFGIFAALAEFERALIAERTQGRPGGGAGARPVRRAPLPDDPGQAAPGPGDDRPRPAAGYRLGLGGF